VPDIPQGLFRIYSINIILFSRFEIDGSIARIDVGGARAVDEGLLELVSDDLEAWMRWHSEVSVKREGFGNLS
jgi:hypothetical protein